MRANVVAAVLLFLALELADGVRASNPLDKQNCTYTLLVETTCAKDAGTSDHISVRFGDAKGTNILAHHLHASHVRRIDATSTYDVDDAPRVPFQACSVDQFHVTGTCVKSHVCYLYLKQNGKDRWRPGLAQVLVQEAHHLSSKSFYFRRFLPQHVWHGSDTCDTEVTPFGIKCTRKVFAPSKHAP